jgi:predicted dehydrogenase
MATHTVGIILNGATGRICSTQHVANALAPIRAEGGLAAGDDRIVPRLMLAGRNAEKLAAVAKSYGAEWTTDLDKALADPAFTVFFDAAATSQRQSVLEKAVTAGKHIYSEKPVALSVDKGLELLRTMNAKGLKHGAVEDKLGLPGLQKLARLAASDFFGRVTGFRIEFGWWVFDGTEVACQRPSWNYRKKDGGGLILDMYPHWRYVIERLIGRIARVASSAWTATPERVDERGIVRKAQLRFHPRHRAGREHRPRAPRHGGDVTRKYVQCPRDGGGQVVRVRHLNARTGSCGHGTDTKTMDFELTVSRRSNKLISFVSW